MSSEDRQCPDPSERRAAIDRALAAAGDATHFVPAEGGYLEVPVVALDQGVLVYRADNGRVLSELADAAQARDTTVEDVKARAESAEVQRLLHDLLIDKARDPAGPIHDELARHARQTEPLLIREDGVVLNGNRRLAAMRDLLERDAAGYGGFARVRAAVLPAGLTRHQIEFIEAALQMAPDLKLDYGWINRRLKLRQHAADMDREAVVAAYRFSDPAEIDRELAQLALAEAYLDWVGAQRDFGRVLDLEDAFVALQAQLAALPKAHLRDTWERIGFAMIKARPDLDRKIMHYFPFTDPAPQAARVWVLRSLAEDHGIVERQREGENRPLEPAAAQRLLSIVGDPGHARDTALASMALIDTLRGNRDRLIGYSRLTALLRNANQTLEGMKKEELTEAQLRQLRGQLAALLEFTGPVAPGDRAEPASRNSDTTLRGAVRKTWKSARRLIE
jgi:hypothetical protein